jgi:hypothetical protein
MSTTRFAETSQAGKRFDKDAGGAEWSIKGTRNCCAGTEMVLLCFSGEGLFVSALCCYRMRCSCLEGGVSHGFRMELAPFGAARAARLFNSACARAVFAAVGRVRCSQRVGAGTFVGKGINTIRPTGIAARNEAPVGTMLGGLGGVSNAIAI